MTPTTKAELPGSKVEHEGKIMSNNPTWPPRQIDADSISDATSDATMDEIIRRYNVHEQLLAACREAHELLVYLHEEHNRTGVILEDAIEAATGKRP